MQQTQDVFRRPAGEKLTLSLGRRGNDVLVDPWPFKEREIRLDIPACRVPGHPFENDDAFRATYASARAEVIHARVLPGRS